MTAIQCTPTRKKECCTISQLQQDIINHFQKDFPLTSRPYNTMVEVLRDNHKKLSEKKVFNTLSELDDLGVISRTGPVFDHKKAGASTLAALAVEEESLDKIASIVNQFEQVNHNYARGSHLGSTNYNLWFVVTASDPVELNHTLIRIELLTGLKVLVLPMEASYHLDLAFSINVTGTMNVNNAHVLNKDNTKPTIIDAIEPLPELKKSQLRKIIESGLPKQLQPYEKLADEINCSEKQVLAQIESWQQTGLIRRFGLVVKHRKLGYNANAMVVWNIAHDNVDAIAEILAKREEVSLCYRRPRRLPDWPYNLFCMIHGTDKSVVLQQIEDITQELALNHIEKDILFSYQAYKQKGASYHKSNDLNTKVSNAHG